MGAMAALFITVLLDLLSFGLVLPDIQLRGQKLVEDLGLSVPEPFGAPVPIEGLVLGLSISLFSIAQLAFGPMLGSLSDRIGRRKVLLITCALATVSGLAYAFATSLAVLMISRIFQGAAAANLGVAFAAVSDIHSKEERAGAMGKLGAAFGVGFMLGPPLGGWLMDIGGGSPLWIGIGAGIFSLINLIFVALFLPETVSDAQKEAAGKSRRGMALVRFAFSVPELRGLLILFFVANFAFANLESTFFLLEESRFGVSGLGAALVLVVVGLGSAAVQGTLVPILSKRFKDAVLLRAGYLIQSPVMACVPFAPPWIPLLAGSLLLAVGGGLANPTLNSLISKNAPPELAGGVFGVTQSLGAVARIVAPLIGLALYDMLYWLPYALAALLLLVPILAIGKALRPSEASA